MDKSGRKTAKKKDFASKAMENDKIWDMKFHSAGVEELEKLLGTKIKD